jgi:protein-tyrosine phosphatase
VPGTVPITVTAPILRSYTVADRFLAGEYPGSPEPELAARRLGAFADHGVTTFVDLTHPADGLAGYEHLLRPGVRRIAHPIVDLGTTTGAHVTRILDDIDDALAAGEVVYVHCWGGIGRTGMVVGCWLVRHELDEGEPLRTLARLRRGTPDAGRPHRRRSTRGGP